VAKFGVNFLSTTHTIPLVHKAAERHHLPVLAGVYSLQDCQMASDLGASALKIFPVSTMSMNKFQHLTNALKQDEKLGLLPIIVSGGVKPEDCGQYINAGASNVAIGFDLSKLSLDDVERSLAIADLSLAAAVR
jgi:2-keto-3-deoxy-6-phosphogluconate aldolase